MNSLKNPRITPRDRGLLKGAMRRAFARSELHKALMAKLEYLPDHKDPLRPRVKKWVRCPSCKQPRGKSEMILDHISPVIPAYTSFEEMGLDETANRLWCDPINLQPICQTPCHDIKTKAEKEAKKALQPPKPKKVRSQRKTTCAIK